MQSSDASTSQGMSTDPNDDADARPILFEFRGVSKTFRSKRGLLSRVREDGDEGGLIHAVRDLDLAIFGGEVLGLVGASGSGKSTTGLLAVGLEVPSSGDVLFEGQDVSRLRSARALREFRRQVQIIFQDPLDSLNPRYTVARTLIEPLKIHGIGSSAKERRRIALDTLDLVELGPPSKFIDRYPHELSGGQRQRVAVGRAVILRPRLVVADEAISMLDVSVRVGLMNLLLRLRKELGITYLFVTHDLAAARYVCDRIAVMQDGELVELGQADALLSTPEHPYTRELLAAVPRVAPGVPHPSPPEDRT